MHLVSIAAAAVLVLASLNEAAPSVTTNAHQHASKPHKLPGLDKIKHVVYFMQENRSFDNYYGSMYGVRGFADPNIGIQSNGLNLLYQPDAKSTDIKNGTKYLLPYQLQGERAGCTGGGSNHWIQNHAAINGGLNNNWPGGNSPASMGYLNRTQIPFLYDLADEFTIADMYFQSVIGSTNPNRVAWMSGTIQGAPNNMVLQDNSEDVPLGWSTYPEVLTNASIPWQLYQDNDNFDDNALAWFKHWQDLPNGPEKNKGTGFLGLQTFYEQAANGTLPAFSIIVGPTELSEHPNNTPLAGSWLQQQVVNAVTHGKGWKDTALFINYDESGGFYDHVQPPLEPESEWVTDHWSGKKVPIGFGPRVPMVIVSPWTRGGYVFSEVSDHTSTLKFLEEWVGTDKKGKYLAPATNIQPFARKTASTLVNAFDFDNPNYSVPKFAPVTKPATNAKGEWDSTAMCEAIPNAPKTKPPYGKQVYPTVESGARPIRGAVTEGRKLVFTSGNKVVQIKNKALSTGSMPKKGKVIQFNKEALFHPLLTGTKGEFKMQSVADNSVCLNVWGNAVTVGECKGTSWYFERAGAQHHIRDVGTDAYLNIHGKKAFLSKSQKGKFKIYSATE